MCGLYIFFSEIVILYIDEKYLFLLKWFMLKMMELDFECVIKILIILFLFFFCNDFIIYMI